MKHLSLSFLLITNNSNTIPDLKHQLHDSSFLSYLIHNKEKSYPIFHDSNKYYVCLSVQMSDHEDASVGLVPGKTDLLRQQ